MGNAPIRRTKYPSLHAFPRQKSFTRLIFLPPVAKGHEGEEDEDASDAGDEHDDHGDGVRVAFFDFSYGHETSRRGGRRGTARTVVVADAEVAVKEDKDSEEEMKRENEKRANF